MMDSVTQAQALDILKTGVNVFLTGEPGSGKTHLVRKYISYLRTQGIETAVTASTGIAATHLNGMTLHSWSGIGVKDRLNKYDVDKLAGTERLAKRIRRTKVLIIDEVSMLPAGVLTGVEAICREVRQVEAPFGGLQVVLVGDFFQLPPVSRDENGASFAYKSPAWERANPLCCYLTDQYRQEDGNFLELLTAIRRNAFDEMHWEYLRQRQADPRKVPEDAPKLFTHNIDVDRINDEKLTRLPGKIFHYVMAAQGREGVVEALKKGCLSPERLSLKEGAAVMFTKNDPKQRFVNGSLGTVAGFSQQSRQPVIKLKTGDEIEAAPMEWVAEVDGKVKGRVVQLPLRLAWAITVHKSQGMSLDAAVMDLSRVFEYGQGYVALSRVRRLSGLHLLGWNERAARVHPEILEIDEHFRAGSEQAEAVFAGMDAAELERLHGNFAAACGGKKIVIAEAFAEVRAKHPNAYRRWSAEQDKELTELFGAGWVMKDLAEKFGRKRGAIRSRLEKLGLIDRIKK